MADENKVISQKQYEDILQQSQAKTRTGEVIEPLFDYNNIDDYTKLAISDVIKMVENNDDKEKLVNVLKDKFQITETPTYDTNKSLWHTMMKEYRLGESIQGFKIIQKPDGTKEKIPVLSFTAELDYLDEVMREILTKLKSQILEDNK